MLVLEGLKYIFGLACAILVNKCHILLFYFQLGFNFIGSTILVQLTIHDF